MSLTPLRSGSNRAPDQLLPERVHPQTLVHARSVGQEGGECGLEHDTEVERPVVHALLDDGVSARLADDQIGPLHDHDRHEERRVAGVLQHLTVGVGLQNRRGVIHNGIRCLERSSMDSIQHVAGVMAATRE